jgi:RIO kinase 2
MIDHATVYKALKPADIKVLRSIENGMKTHEWVPAPDMAAYTDLSEKTVDFRLHILSDMDLIDRYTATYVGYQLKYNGYDILAINTFVKRNIIQSLGGILGVGKESIVLAALGGSAVGSRPLAIKFHREGRTAFKQVKRKREHLVDLEHFSWLYASKLAAQREFEALKALYPKVSVPEPVDYDRHAIVMNVIEGYDLSRATLVDAEWYLDKILAQVKLSYEMGYINGDLSEYNVIVREEGVTVIDWPQYVTLESKLADKLLERDVYNVLTYFERKYRVKKDIQKVLKNIKETQA